MKSVDSTGSITNSTDIGSDVMLEQLKNSVWKGLTSVHFFIFSAE